jgi:hypothetical protein
LWESLSYRRIQVLFLLLGILRIVFEGKRSFKRKMGLNILKYKTVNYALEKCHVTEPWQTKGFVICSYL